MDATAEQAGGITLPEGYEVGTPPPPGVAPRDVVPGYDLYGGATVTEATDAAGVTFMACCAKLNGGPLYFRVFKLVGSTASEIPLTPLCEGRGSVSVDLHSGQLRWIAWQGSTFWRGVVPGSAVFPPLGSNSGQAPPPSGAWPPPPSVAILAPESRLVLQGGEAPCCAIDSRGWVYYLERAAVKDVANSAAMRVVEYPPNSYHGIEVRLDFNPTGQGGNFVQVANRLYLIAHHTHNGVVSTVSVPIPGGVGPFTMNSDR